MICAAVSFAGSAFATANLIVSPDCPAPTQSVAVEVSAPYYKAGRGLAFGAAPTCRFYGLFPYFYGSPPQQTDTFESHFFSGDAIECATVAAKYGDVWLLESADAFEMILPDRQSGVCPAATKPVYRLYDTDGLPPNHMYTTSKKARSDMITQAGWKPEGYGPDGVVMCTPQ